MENVVKVMLTSQIDCEGNPITASVEAEVPSGGDELDVALYDAMAAAVRLLAKAARDDQARTHSAQAAQ